ncbi:hypothetical protein Tco_0228793 [Tanacetum coccineum]
MGATIHEIVLGSISFPTFLHQRLGAPSLECQWVCMIKNQKLFKDLLSIFGLVDKDASGSWEKNRYHAFCKSVLSRIADCLSYHVSWSLLESIETFLSRYTCEMFPGRDQGRSSFTSSNKVSSGCAWITFEQIEAESIRAGLVVFDEARGSQDLIGAPWVETNGHEQGRGVRASRRHVRIEEGKK